MVVGDDDQSIYRFRGATVENILSFDKTYPDATVIRLEQNYRSTETILDAANAVIKNNSERHGKSLWSENGKGELITLRRLADQNEEGRYIIDRISKAVKNDGKHYSDFAVLYRINALGRSLQTSFAKSGVPYRVVGDMGFYDRKEVKDMMAYLSVLVSPFDNLRLKRIINEPKRKIGQATVDAIEEIASANGVEVATFENVKYSDFGVGTNSYEPALVGAIAKTKSTGAVSAPVKGSSVAAVFVVDGISTTEEQTAEAEKVRRQSFQETIVPQMAVTALQNMVEIEDLRGKYF
jgi:superfamily I DNA/RNA helicase